MNGILGVKKRTSFFSLRVYCKMQSYASTQRGKTTQSTGKKERIHDASLESQPLYMYTYDTLGYFRARAHKFLSIAVCT